MRDRYSGSMTTVAIAAAAVSAVISVSITGTSKALNEARKTVPFNLLPKL
jgi:hypothetical protein